MEEYTEEALADCFIQSTTLPAASRFFFMQKKNGELQPCIDY